MVCPFDCSLTPDCDEVRNSVTLFSSEVWTARWRSCRDFVSRRVGDFKKHKKTYFLGTFNFIVRFIIYLVSKWVEVAEWKVYQTVCPVDHGKCCKNIWQIYLVTTLELIKQTSETQEMKVNKMLLKNHLPFSMTSHMFYNHFQVNPQAHEILSVSS